MGLVDAVPMIAVGLALYVLFARNTRSPQHITQVIEKLRSSLPNAGRPAVAERREG